jgi:hypothetical protein
MYGFFSTMNRFVFAFSMLEAIFGSMWSKIKFERQLLRLPNTMFRLNLFSGSADKICNRRTYATSPLCTVFIRGCTQKFPDWVDNEIYAYNNKHSLRSNSKGCGGKLTRLTHKIATQLHLVAESCTICSFRSRRPVRKLLDTPSYTLCRSHIKGDPLCLLLNSNDVQIVLFFQQAMWFIIMCLNILGTEINYELYI